MNSRFLISVLILLILAGAANVCASDFTIHEAAVKDKIFLNQTAEFTLNITNNMDSAASFLIYPGVVEWDIVTIPDEDRQVKIEAGKSKVIRVMITPNQKFWANIYGVPIRVKNLKTSEVITKVVLVEIRGEGGNIQNEFLPAIQITSSVAKKIDPRNGITIKVALKNQNRLNISRVRIVVKSNLVNKEYETSLLGLESKTMSFMIPVNSILPPQNDLLNVKAIIPYKDKSYEFYARSKEYSIIQYGMISKNSTTDSRFLKKTETIILKNTGNVDRDYKYQIKKQFFSSLFVKTIPRPVVEYIDNNQYFVWNGRLSPQEEHSITVIISYRWLALFILIVLAVWISYYLFRNPVVITKSAVILAKNEGGVSQLKIQLHLKNRSSKKFNSLEIRDKVPNLLIVKNEFTIGTIRPTNILKHSKRGTIIKWNIDEFDSFEERIITYNTSAKLPILGEFSLPKAAVKYKKKVSGDYRYSHSNIFRIDYS